MSELIENNYKHLFLNSFAGKHICIFYAHKVSIIYGIAIKNIGGDLCVPIKNTKISSFFLTEDKRNQSPLWRQNFVTGDNQNYNFSCVHPCT